jgi:hypothetical protein
VYNEFKERKSGVFISTVTMLVNLSLGLGFVCFTLA